MSYQCTTIAGLMIQGGDPTNTGKGGESIWGHTFIDEFHPDYSHGNCLIPLPEASLP